MLLSSIIRSDNFKAELQETLQKIRNDPDYEGHVKADPTTFWLFFLRVHPEYFKPDIKKVLLIIFSIPVSNAEVERGFSLMTNVKRRGPREGVDALNALLFIKINGPDDEMFDRIGSAKEWAINHELVDNPIPLSRSTSNSTSSSYGR